MNAVSILFIITIIVVVVILWQVFPKKNTQVSTNNLIELDEKIDDSLPMILEGKIIKKDFHNKVGRKIEGVADYFFETKEEKIFIRFNVRGGGIDKNAILENVDKKVKIKAIKENGLWDASDGNYQSRIGEYLIIKSFL